VAELATADLRFDREELERLFRDTYRHPLEADLLDDLARTTEGWAATLRLLQAAIRGRPRDKVRAVIEGLSAQHGDLHDYLAEEVVGRMTPELQAFLERCSLLQVATPQLAAVAAAVSESDARRLLEVAEEAGLISRRGRTGQAGRLLHPLVRSFLEGRLLDAVGRDRVAEIHARIAAAAELNSWWLAAHHFSAAGRPAEVARVLSGSLESILGSGSARAAVDLTAGAGIGDAAGWVFALEARAHLSEGRFAEARKAAQEALVKSTLGDSTIPLTVALATLTTVELNSGEYVTAVGHAARLREVAAGTLYEAIADSVLAVAESMIDGSLARAALAVSRTAALARQLGHEHYFGISHLNLAWLLRADGDAKGVLASTRLALDSLAATSAGPEMDTVRTVAAWAHAHKGEVDRAARELELALASRFSRGRFEILLESADVLGTYVDPERGWSLVVEAEAVGPATIAERRYLQLIKAEALLRLGRPADAVAALARIEPGRHSGYPGFYIRVALARAAAALLADATDISQCLSEAAVIVERQDARGMEKAWRLLDSLARAPESASQLLVALWSVEPGAVVANAEAILARLGTLEEPAIGTVLKAAQARPGRWLPGLRRVIESGTARAKWAAGRILEVVGEQADVARLRALSRELKGQYRSPTLGRALARRTADRVWVEDLGRIVLRIGSRVVPGTAIRRRPLALLCLLLSRPGLSATRDQVLDALWPETDPEQAVNSLHQTVYFLRRVIEPAYSDDLSPGYVHQDGELVWLDEELITSRSVRCRELLKGLGPDPAAGDVLAMAAEYRGRFALDFSYDDWAAAYRDSLHARYLEVMERAIASASSAGRFLEAMELSRAVLETDPSLDQIQASLVKLYRVVGAHAAAAEQYGQYASVMRHDLGLEPSPLESL
jgi:DNA-binding SARP family transcriptional activator